MRALIVEQGHSRGALAAVRALASAGWRVGVGAPAGDGLASSSRFCARRHLVPAAHDDVHAFLAAVRAAVRDEGYEVVFGAGESEVLALSEHRDAVGAVVPHGDHADVLRALDKGGLEEAAAAAGFRVPDAVDPEVLADPAARVIVKARRHARPGVPGAPPRIDTTLVVGADAVRRRVAEIRAVGGDPQVQVFHEGPLVAYAAVVARDGSVVADAMQAASLIWPPHAGASCRARTVPVDAAVAARAARLFAALGWFGLAELQFVAPPDGILRLIDLNGRFYGSLALAVAAGANLPATWAALATGRDAAPSRARAGVRYQWLHGDLRRALRERRGGATRDVVTTLAAGVAAVHSVLSASDPAPALAQVRRARADRPAAAAGVDPPWIRGSRCGRVGPE